VRDFPRLTNGRRTVAVRYSSEGRSGEGRVLAVHPVPV